MLTPLAQQLWAGERLAGKHANLCRNHKSTVHKGYEVKTVMCIIIMIILRISENKILNLCMDTFM